MAEQLPQHSAAAFVATCNAGKIAKRLRNDTSLVNEGQLCSWIALYTPQSGTPGALGIARCLTPSPDLSDNVKRMLYESIVSRIKKYLNDSGIFATQHEIDVAANQRSECTSNTPHEIPSEQICTTLEVLNCLLEQNILSPDLPLSNVVASLKKMVVAGDEHTRHLNDGSHTSATSKHRIPKPPILPRRRLCYICRLLLKVPHPTQPSMCTICGAFNLASSQISTPSNLSLPPTFAALVTGARINLGYHTALRLLRCGARVLATTRYPRDAVARYVQESDFPIWKDRLRVIGADFRSAADVFALVEETRQCLRDWGGAEKLRLLVNNAAQTLTDSVRKEEKAIEREAGLLRLAETSTLHVSSSYKSRVRGGASPMALADADNDLPTHPTAVRETVHTCDSDKSVETYSKSSWVQNLFEIPYEDVISAHSVNTFVPLILCRELLPSMGKDRDPSEEDNEQVVSNKPEAYIVNVSSREGIFENQTRSISKAGKHVHTNMSKAALNMITETEAASAWHSRRVAMNTVDPGYMSAAPEYENAFDGKRPIGWEDGAGRVLWTVAVGELEGKAVWGRFLKHYGAVEVEPGAGRG